MVYGRGRSKAGGGCVLNGRGLVDKLGRPCYLTGRGGAGRSGRGRRAAGVPRLIRQRNVLQTDPTTYQPSRQTPGQRGSLLYNRCKIQLQLSTVYLTTPLVVCLELETPFFASSIRQDALYAHRYRVNPHHSLDL